jgi:hypothetical protein
LAAPASENQPSQQVVTLPLKREQCRETPRFLDSDGGRSAKRPVVPHGRAFSSFAPLSAPPLERPVPRDCAGHRLARTLFLRVKQCLSHARCAPFTRDRFPRDPGVLPINRRAKPRRFCARSIGGRFAVGLQAKIATTARRPLSPKPAVLRGRLPRDRLGAPRRRYGILRSPR